jgi:hypothetical protein
MTPSSIADFSLQAATRYLQSAVFIDDDIYNHATANPDEIANVDIRQPKAVFQSDVTREKAPAGEHIVTEKQNLGEIPRPPFRTKDLVGNFAQHGIVCALYEPEKNFPTDEKSTVFRLCETADLVILDWDFHEDGVKGTKPKALIEKLIASGNRVAPHHVRLIAIYTNTPSLWTIANSILQHLQSAAIAADLIGANKLRLQAGAARVVVFGKAGGADRVAEEQSFTVAETALADTLLKEFAAMNQGILPSCALLGMAAVRQNSRRILDKFRSDLDGQFLLHRALIRSSEEAFDQLPELLGDEFRAVIEDADYKPDDTTKFVADSCADVPVKPHTNPWKVGGVDCHTILKAFWVEDNNLRKRLDGKDRELAKEDGAQPKKPTESIAVMCSVADADAHQRFAALLAIRTQYQINHRDLAFGAIVLKRNSQEYSVCIMPLCDCLRLKNTTAFPFWRLSTTGKGNPVIVQRDNGKLLKLIFENGRPSVYMWMATFTPDETRGIVTATRISSGEYTFKAGEIEFEWIAQLKPSHAQRIANTIGQQLSRVGLTEAEWARVTFASE